MIYTLDSIGEGDYPMTWTPSQGLKRAEPIVSEIERAAGACEIPFTGASDYRLLRHRMVEVIAKAIDQALADEQDALALIVGQNGHLELPDGWRRDPDGLVHAASPLSPAAELTGQSLPDFPEIPKITPREMLATMDTPPEPKKTRGRPKGAKGKKRKGKAPKVEAVKEDPVQAEVEQV